MRRIIFLDSGPLGLACDNPDKDKTRDTLTWLAVGRASGSAILIPQITDYEVRRKLLHRELNASLTRLDQLSSRPGSCLPITTRSIRRAAGLWAEARRQGQPTSGGQSIDGDVILAAQALEYCSDADDWWVATENEQHLSRDLGDRARPWRLIGLPRPS